MSAEASLLMVGLPLLNRSKGIGQTKDDHTHIFIRHGRKNPDRKARNMPIFMGITLAYYTVSSTCHCDRWVYELVLVHPCLGQSLSEEGCYDNWQNLQQPHKFSALLTIYYFLMKSCTKKVSYWSDVVQDKEVQPKMNLNFA